MLKLPLSIALGAMLPSVGYAQDAPPAPKLSPTKAEQNAAATGDIVVTAQRKTERLQDIPIAVTAVTAESVQNLGLTRISDIAAITPGASFAVNIGFFSPHIRGIGVDFVSVGTEAPVAVYEDGAYLTRTLTVSEILDNFDISSIQVLRGPQGTLYGRNATGGVIIINSADPTSKFEGRVRGELGNFDHRQLNAMINVPLGKDLAFRATGGYRNDDGYIHNLTTGKDVAGSRTYNVRAKLRWRPENADIVLGGQYYNTKGTLALGESLAYNDATCLACAFAPPGTISPSLGYYEQQSRVIVTPTVTKYYGANLKMTFDVGNFDLTSTTTFRRQNTRNSSGDTDLTPLPVFEFASPRSGGTSYTQDAQLTSKLDGRFNYLFGLSYLYDKGYFNTRFLADPAFGGTGLDPKTAFGADNTAITRSYAAFAEGYFKVTDQVKATLGGRYTYEKRKGIGLLNFPGAMPFEMSASQRAFTPRFVLAWDNGPTNVYYSYTRGFKAGGFPGPFFGIVPPVLPEKIASHEIGIKHKFSNQLRVAAAAFRYNNKGLQVQTLDLANGGAKTGNASLKNHGVEVEAQIVPVNGLNIGLSAAWQHARFGKYVAVGLACVVPGGGLGPCNLDLTGTRPPHAPEWSGSANASYEFALGSWSAMVSGLATYRSSIDFQTGAGGNLKRDRDHGLFLVNTSGYVSPPGRQLRLGYYVNNVFNKKYAGRIGTAQPFGTSYAPARPRTYGLRVEYAF